MIWSNFLDVVGERISETSLKIYQAQLANLKISAQKRKISACNQFLYFLYQKGEVDSFYRLELAKQAEKKTEKPEILDLDSFWQESAYPEGRLLALLILEWGSCRVRFWLSRLRISIWISGVANQEGFPTEDCHHSYDLTVRIGTLDGPDLPL